MIFEHAWLKGHIPSMEASSSAKQVELIAPPKTTKNDGPKSAAQKTRERHQRSGRSTWGNRGKDGQEKANERATIGCQIYKIDEVAQVLQERLQAMETILEL